LTPREKAITTLIILGQSEQVAIELVHARTPLRWISYAYVLYAYYAPYKTKGRLLLHVHVHMLLYVKMPFYTAGRLIRHVCLW